MKKSWILAGALLFVSAAAFAQTPPSHTPLTQEALTAILGLPAAGSCATQPSGVRQVAKRPAILTGKSACTATATCQFFGVTVSCAGNNNPGICTSVDANCPAGEPGHVICDGVTTYCPACCTGAGPQFQCCKCDEYGDCISCCRCAGGDLITCGQQCS